MYINICILVYIYICIYIYILGFPRNLLKVSNWLLIPTSGREIASKGMLNVAGRGMSTEEYLGNIAVHPPIRGFFPLASSTRSF